LRLAVARFRIWAMMSSNPVRKAMLLAVLLAAAAVAIDGLLISEEELLEEHLDSLTTAFSVGDQGTIDALLAPSFSYVGPRPVGEGERAESLARLDDFWLETSEPRLQWRASQVRVEGRVGRIEAQGTVRFRYGGSLIVYRADAVLVWERAGEGWLLRRLDLPLLRPGII